MAGALQVVYIPDTPCLSKIAPILLQKTIYTSFQNPDRSNYNNVYDLL